MKSLFILSLLFVFVGGCAMMNTFQTPKVKQPGKVSIGIGGGLRLVDSDRRTFDYPLVPFDGYVRVGVIPRLDIGVRTAGFISYGGDVKYQFLKVPFPVSVSAGFGTGKDEYFGDESTTRFIGIIAGYDQFYYGFKLTDYYYRELAENGEEIEKIIPAISVGFTAPDNQSISPMFEVNSYFVPEVITTANVGLKINLY